MILKTRLLYKLGVLRSRSKVPPDEEIGICTSNGGMKAQAILPSIDNHSFDGLTFEKSHE